MGDLNKYDEAARSQTEVGKIASKFHSFNSFVSDDCFLVMKAELLGNKIQMDGRPITSRGHFVRNTKGETGYFLDQQPEIDALQKWESGHFEIEEREFASKWRKITKSADLISFQKYLKHAKHLPYITSLDELRAAAEATLNNKDMQLFYLRRVMEKVGLQKKDQLPVLFAFKKKNVTIKEFAPYVAHCLLVDIAFSIALKNQLIGTRSTNVLDIIYLYYLPFCKIFASSDETQLKMARALFSDYRDIVSGQDLKQDLKRMNNYMQDCNEKEIDWRKDFGSFPPGDQSSLTVSFWEKYMGEKEKFVNPPKLSPEESKKLAGELSKEIAHIKKQMKMR